MGTSPEPILQSLSKYSLLMITAHFHLIHALLSQKQPDVQRDHKRGNVTCAWGASSRTAQKLGISRFSKQKIEAHQNRLGIIQLGTSNALISIPITAYMGHQREKGENKTSYFQCFTERENNIVFSSFPSGFHYASSSNHSTPPLGLSPSQMLGVSGPPQQIQSLKRERTRDPILRSPINKPPRKKQKVFFSNPLRKHVFCPHLQGTMAIERVCCITCLSPKCNVSLCKAW